MARSGIFVHLVIVVVFLTWEARSALTADSVYAMLSDQLNNMEKKVNAIEEEMRNSVVLINHRIDDVESQITPNSKITEAKKSDRNMKRKEVKMQKALVATKTYVRVFLNEHYGKLNEFQNIISDQIKLMNKTVETTTEKMKTENEENTIVLKNSIKLMKETVEVNNEQMKIENEENALILKNSIQLMKDIVEENNERVKIENESTLALKNSIGLINETVWILKTAMENTSTEHVIDYNTLHERLNEVDTKIETVERHVEHTVDNRIQQIETTRNRTVGFYGHVLKHTSVTQSERIMFDVAYNDGDGYNKKSGKFTAPTSGVYIFHVSVDGSFWNGGLIKQVKCKLYDSDHVISRMDSSTPTEGVSITYLRYLRVGDESYVTCSKLSTTGIYVYIYFTAILVI